MAKAKNIDGITYFPRKQHQNCYCSKCNKFIESTTLSYLVGNLNSNRIICTQCVNTLFTENQVTKDKGTNPFPTEIPLYIGISHSCPKQPYENILFYFINEEKIKKINVKKCTNCGKLFIDTESYNKNSFYFSKYRLINSLTQKEIVKFNSATQFFHPQQKSTPEIPAHLQWFAKHPYRGGGFSGK